VTVDRDKPQWARHQAAELLRSRLEAGELGPKLPPYPKLAGELGVSQMTLKRAIDILKQEGIVYSVPRMGVFVAVR
jgi:DNA-binding GntR family transcriptional regulator